MKMYKVENAPVLDDMEMTKTRITIKGDDVESIWCKKDPEGNAYLMNHAMMFYPFPSWGLQVNADLNGDLSSIRGESTDDTVMYLHPEAYDNLSEFIGEDGEFDIPGFLENVEAAHNAETKEEE